MNHHGYGEQSYIPCECCTSPAVDVHHLIPRGMGGSKTKDHIENLMGLCRKCHNKAEANPDFNEKLKLIHKQKL